MADGLNIVLDIGKSFAKASLWTSSGELLERRTRPNQRIESTDYISLDVRGIEIWIRETLREFSTLGRVTRLIPVAHGAAFAVLRDGKLAVPPPDYEEPIPASVLEAYRAERDDFALTGSPTLPDGLNLGSQLFWLETLYPDLLNDAAIVPWPQYWSWLLSGVAASELTSLGCHSDLWNPIGGDYSPLAKKRGWAARMAPIRRAGDVLGKLSPEWVAGTGLPKDVAIYCGLHDSNAALIAARAFPEIANRDSTVLSTGTWFVAMRTPATKAIDIPALLEARDCLVNVDVYGNAIPSARFMGGREIETLIGFDTRRVEIKPDQPALLAAVPWVLASGAMVLPTFAPGFGPYPEAPGRWIAMPDDWYARRTAACLYAALVVDTSLDLIGSRECLVIEGRFAEAEVFVRALVSLRRETKVYVAQAHNDLAFGALRLIEPKLRPASKLTAVTPLEQDISAYRAQWRRSATRLAGTAA